VADLRAGVSAAVIGLPQEINYGLLAVAPLGIAFAGHGIAVALYVSVLTVVVTLLLGAGLGRVSGPRPTLCILLAGLFLSLQQQPGFSVATAPAYAALTVFIAGVSLLLAARFGLGRFIKYMPVPVLSGFNNGIAAMLLISALPLALGIGFNAGSMTGWLVHIQPAALLVAAVTIWFSTRPMQFSVLRHIPGIVQALVVAWLLHLIFEDGMHLSTGPMLGDLVHSLPDPSDLIPAWVMPVFSAAMLGVTFKFALAIAVTAALETLATSASIDSRLCERSSGDEKLQRLGYTMLCVSPFGMPVASSLGRSMTLLSTGALSRAAHWYYVACLLAMTLLGYGLIAQLPQAAIAGILVVVAYNMAGDSLAQIWEIRAWSERKRSVADFMVMLLVAFITVADSFVTGLIVGVVSAMMIFIRDQSRSVVRRIQFGNHCHSLKLRSPAARAVQLQHGQEIAVVEAEGTIFFGSAESLGETLESLSGSAKEIILDLRRINDIDGTACLLLEQTARRLSEKGCLLIFAHLAPARRLYDLLKSRGLAARIPLHTWFADLDSALEYAESHLLARHGITQEASEALALSHSDIAMGLTAEQLKILEAYLTHRHAQCGDVIFRQGDSGNSMFVLTRGAVSIHIPQTNGYGKRLAALGPGALLGEMAFITDVPRSADALADEETELLELDRQHFHELEKSHPAIAVAMLRAISIALAERLRDRTDQVRDLSET